MKNKKMSSRNDEPCVLVDSYQQAVAYRYYNRGCILLNIAICDDDATVCRDIRTAVYSFEKKYNVPVNVILFTTGEELLEALKYDSTVNLLFLDLFLKTKDGLEVARIIRTHLKNQTIQIVYVSNVKKLTTEMFESRPMNFLAKPITEDRIIAEIRKYLELSKSSDKLFKYKIGGDIYSKRLDEILYFESLGRQIKIVFFRGEAYFYGRLKEIFDELKMDGFSYIHRSYLVNVGHIAKYARIRVIMSDGSELPVSKGMSKDFKVSLIQ